MRPFARCFARVGALALVLGWVISACGGDGDGKVPALSQADKNAGIVCVIYPDHSLPDAPDVAVVRGTRVALFLTTVSDADRDVTAELRVAVG
ncbi:MAG: hypothetical protein QOK15_2863 [Nocardioidaceae bacterium]|nr:hypothetical protein [Nocardioidaceae bacterium]